MSDDNEPVFLSEEWIAERMRRSALVQRFKKRVWTCQDGSTIAVAEMVDRHLLNTYRMLKRKGFVSEKSFRFYLTDPGPNGEMAQDAFKEELDYVLGCRVSPWLDVFEDEIKKRGLKA